MHRSMNNPVWSPRQQPLTSTRRKVMPAFETDSAARGGSPADCVGESVPRAKADDAPGVEGPDYGARRVIGLSRAVSVA
jgi:hypothetical protein